MRNLRQSAALVLATAMLVGTIPAMNIEAKQKYTTKTEDGKEYIVFGSYEQDGNAENGKEAVEWEVLGEDKNGILVVSRFILDCQPYVEDYASISGEDYYLTDMSECAWKASSLRKWLNSDFCDTAFSAKEKKKIKKVKVKNSEPSVFMWGAGKNTKDKLFCLSVEEIKANVDNLEDYGFMIYSDNLQAAATAYAKNCGVETADGDIGSWWLRPLSYIDANGMAGGALESGVPAEILHEGNYIGVRPAMYLKK